MAFTTGKSLLNVLADKMGLPEGTYRVVIDIAVESIVTATVYEHADSEGVEYLLDMITGAEPARTSKDDTP